MGKDYVPDYEDYKALINTRKDILHYYSVAKDLKEKMEGGNLSHQHYEELLRKTTYNVSLSSGTWSGQDAESYAQTARDICKKLREAEQDFIQELQAIMEYCDKEAERYRILINETKEKMDAGAKVLHVWNAGVLGKTDG